MTLGAVLFALLQSVVFGRPVLVGRPFQLPLLRRLRLPLTLPLALSLALAWCRRLVLRDGRRRDQRHECGNERCAAEFALHSVLSV
jgi:hypothetical protein